MKAQVKERKIFLEKQINFIMIWFCWNQTKL